MQKLLVKFAKLQNALKALENIYLKPTLEDRSNIDATIQRFEFTFELFWKFCQEYFRQRGLEINYPRDIIKQAFADNLIDDEELWLQMLHDRNLTSHTYEETLADLIFARIKLYVPVIRKAVELLTSMLND